MRLTSPGPEQEAGTGDDDVLPVGSGAKGRLLAQPLRAGVAVAPGALGERRVLVERTRRILGEAHGGDARDMYHAPASRLPRRGQHVRQAVDVDRLQARLVLRVVGEHACEVEDDLSARAGDGQRLGLRHVARDPLDGESVEGVARAALENADGAALLLQAGDEGAPHEAGCTGDEHGTHGGAD